ncbi:MAG TPA: N-methyl-L-tryptophan oxidase [Tepidisphaeraceae bacterium]|nr:N-methyl-L-tryptophan oxidase [Tepidisphaeraceae bacterium]
MNNADVPGTGAAGEMDSKNKNFDVIVVGVGSMGSSACYHLAKRGVRVLGLERFDIPHGMGAAHGFSRMIRLAYFEHPDYVPLLRRSYALWTELAAELGREVMLITGGLMIGPPGAHVFEGSLRSVRQYDLPHELLDIAETSRRFPQFKLPEDFRVLHDHKAGLVLPERAVAGYAEMAMRRGAELHGQEPIVSWEAPASQVIVTTTKARYSADRVIFCGGAWTDKLVRDLGVPLTVTRQPLAWVWPKSPQLFELGKMPVWILEHRDGSNHYGFPMLPDNPGFKLASHKRSTPVDVDHLDRSPNDADEQAIRGVLKDFIPAADGPLLSLRVCMYTNSPDFNFIIDRHPRHANVFVACGFSGHGFKCASALGEVLAQLALDGRCPLPVEFLQLKRFGVGT